jgi:hypothetical protein
MLDFLHLHALWLIMDPWLPHPWPRDRKQWPDIDEHNQITVDLIVGYLPRLQHVAISVAPQYRIHPALSHLPNTENQLECLIDIMQQRSLTDVVYIGFHWGVCMLHKPDGAINVAKHTSYKIHAYRPLCSVFPGSNEMKLSKKMSGYLTFL